MPRKTSALLPALALLGLCNAAWPHVVLPPGGAAAGSTYPAAFKVGHACKDAKSTTALSVELPKGFTFVSAQARTGWTMASSPTRVTWTASTPQAALPATSPDSFVVVGKLTDKPGTLWFHALQTCDVGQSDWAVIPGAADPKPQFPAPHLDVLAKGIAAVDVRDAWARPTVPGQTTSGLYGRLMAPAGARFVGVSTPVGDADIHQMKLDGDTMRMRALPEGLDLPPGQVVELGSNGFHIMLTALKQPLALGSTIPVTLHFVDRDGRKGDVSLQVPVSQAPAGQPMDEHLHMH
jgi:copper(I)-binding protein